MLLPRKMLQSYHVRFLCKDSIHYMGGGGGGGGGGAAAAFYDKTRLVLFSNTTTIK